MWRPLVINEDFQFNVERSNYFFEILHSAFVNDALLLLIALLIVLEFIKHYRQSPRVTLSLLFIFRPYCFEQRCIKEFAIAKLIFTQQLTRFTEAPEVDTSATTLRAGLDAAFQLNPRLRGYVLDEQAHLRKHVVIFVDGVRMRDRVTLDVPLSSDSTVHILQALSGG
jgi:sulfur-carrier protein